MPFVFDGQNLKQYLSFVFILIWGKISWLFDRFEPTYLLCLMNLRQKYPYFLSDEFEATSLMWLLIWGNILFVFIWLVLRQWPFLVWWIWGQHTLACFDNLRATAPFCLIKLRQLSSCCSINLRPQPLCVFEMNLQQCLILCLIDLRQYFLCIN